MNNTVIKKRLNEIVKKRADSIEKEVALNALDYVTQNYADFFKDLSKYGCQSGMISSLIYYSDTHDFFRKHYEEIEKLRNEVEDEFNIKLSPKGDLMNWYSWFAFEEVARRMAMNFGIL